jgi:hypothetical protein
LKFHKPLSIIRKITLSLFIILVVYLISIYPGSNRLIQRIIPPSGDIPRQKWDQRMRVRVYTTYLLCGHLDSIVYNHPNQRFIKEVISLQDPDPDYKVQPQGRMLIYRIRKRDWCPSCGAHQFLGVNNQNVVVRYGTPGRPGPVRETIHIKLNRLPDSERNDLIRGILFRDNKEKLQIIEGLSEVMGEP